MYAFHVVAMSRINHSRRRHVVLFLILLDHTVEGGERSPNYLLEMMHTNCAEMPSAANHLY